MAATGSRNYPNRIIAESKQRAPTGLLNPFLIAPQPRSWRAWDPQSHTYTPQARSCSGGVR